MSTKEMMEAQGFIPLSVAAKRSGMSRRKLERLIREGRVEASRPGGEDEVYAHWYVSCASLIAYVGPEWAVKRGLVAAPAKT